MDEECSGHAVTITYFHRRLEQTESISTGDRRWIRVPYLHMNSGEDSLDLDSIYLGEQIVINGSTT